MTTINTTRMIIQLAVVLTVLTYSCSAACPENCECVLDDRGRRKVSCAQGGLVGSLDVSRMDPGTEVLEITAPEDNLNSLMIGPIFDTFTEIEEIHLMRSNIPEIGMHSFWKLPNLEVLNLRENNISTVLDHNFRGLPNLKYLYLDDNRIDRLSSGTFRYLESLRVLSLTKNRLDELVTRVFEKLTKLHELNLSENMFDTLNAEVFVDIPDLRVLQCRACGLKEVNAGTFHSIVQLTTLDLGENDLRHLAIDTFHELVNLKSLWLDKNKLSALSAETFSAQIGLMKLNIARNSLTTLSPKLFENVTELMNLDLSYNRLEDLNVTTFEPFASASLQSLDLSGNRQLPVADIQLLLQLSRRVEYLGLADMELSELPLGVFDFNAELLSLNLASNQFVQFPLAALSPVPRLNELDITNNWLRRLDDEALLRLESVSIVRLHHNRWACDLCHVVPALEKMNRTLYLQDLRCHSPYYLKGRRFGSLRIYDLKKCSSTDELMYERGNGMYLLEEGQLGVIAAGAGLLLLVLTVTALLAGVCYSRRHAANYYTHEEKRNMENDPMFENTDILFGDNADLNFKFPMDQKITISTIDEIKKDPGIQAITKGS